MGKRIVILTDGSDRHFYFCNRIIEETGNVVGVITGGKEINRPKLEQVRKTASRHVVQTLRQRYYQRRYRTHGVVLKNEKRRSESLFFSGSANSFLSDYSDFLLASVTSEFRSINDLHFIETIRRAKPDVIAVMGTCILARGILDSAPVVLNMHTGLSPYYRGGRTNFWPFVDNNPGYFGVTVHKMSRGIDSGDIVFSERVVPEPGDTYGSINCKSIVAGTRLMIDALKQVEAGTCRALPQWTSGKVFYDRDWTFKAAKMYFENRDRLVQRQIAGEARGDYTQILTVRNGMVDND
ncbi:formyl transferase [Roseibium polysiphoniae]|uniref:formyl transferase n=1 Tax=Roseibium polysiphoniae TaxID=2571221 RepID=UPI00329A5B8C